MYGHCSIWDRHLGSGERDSAYLESGAVASGSLHDYFYNESFTQPCVHAHPHVRCCLRRPDSHTAELRLSTKAR